MKNLQPWIDYFKMLMKFEDSGYLEVLTGRHEAYITRAALCTMVGISPQRIETRPFVMMRTLRMLRAFAAWKGAASLGYLDRPFVVHVVTEEKPHDPLLVLMLERRRRWWKLWMKTDVVTPIDM